MVKVKANFLYYYRTKYNAFHYILFNFFFYYYPFNYFFILLGSKSFDLVPRSATRRKSGLIPTKPGEFRQNGANRTMKSCLNLF